MLHIASLRSLLPYEPLSVSTGLEQEKDQRGNKRIIFCDFCTSFASVTVEGAPFCITHGAAALSSSIRLWLSQFPEEE